MKSFRLVLLVAIIGLFTAVSVAADVVYTDDFESYNLGGIDKNLATGPNYAPENTGQPWFGPYEPNAVVVGVDSGVTPHSGSKMIRGKLNASADIDQNWINIAYRFNGGKPYTGNVQFDFWFYDALGAGGSTLKDYAALCFYNTAPADQEYPNPTAARGTDANLNVGATQIQRLSLGAQASPANLNVYQCRVVGATDGYSSGWINTKTPRSIGWHHCRILVGSALPDATNSVCFFVDDMDHATAFHNSVLKWGYNVLEVNTEFGAQTGYFDDVTFSTVTGSATTLGAISSAADGALADIGSAEVVAVGGGIPNDTLFIESADRSAAARVQVADASALKVGPGDTVTIMGKVQTAATGERYIAAYGVTRLGSMRPVDAVGMSNKAAADAKAEGMFAKLWGTVQSVGSDNFVISDGSGAPVKVICGTSMTKPNAGDMIRVRGAVSKDADGPVLYMNNEQVDWTAGSASYQPLPFPGTYKYARDFLIIGPFAADSTLVTDADRLGHDFISDATGGQVSESTLWQSAYSPAPGVALGDKVWKRSSGVGDNVVFTNEYPTNNYNCVFYAHIWLYSPTDQTIAMRIGSDDCSMIYIDGQQCYETSTLAGRGEQQGQDLVDYLPVHSGFNSILVKVENGPNATGNPCACDIQFVSFDNPGAAGYGGAAGWPGLGYLLANPVALQ